MAQPCNLEDVEGTSARIFRSGRVSIGSEWATVLRFRIGQKPAQDMLGSAAQVRVHLGEFSLQLKNNSTVLYTKPYERLLASAQGPEWLVQLVHQQNIARRPGFSDLSPSTAPGPHSSAITPHNVSLEEHWKNPELRHRLLRGDIFKCTRSIHQGHPSYRIYFRGITFYLPQEAAPDSIFIQCDLSPLGIPHRHQCAKGTTGSDPAQRLGIQLTYTQALTGESKQIWLQQKGKSNICKLNSLVDFFGGESSGLDRDAAAKIPGSQCCSWKALGRIHVRAND